MIYTGKLLYAELYDDSTYPCTGVRAVYNEVQILFLLK